MRVFTGNEGRFLDDEEASQFTEAYAEQKRKQGISDAERVCSEFFGINKLQKLLAKPGCVGIRIYHAKRREDFFGNPSEGGGLRPRVILVGVDAEGNDMITQPEVGLEDTTNGRGGMNFLGDGPICPPECNGDDKEKPY